MTDTQLSERLQAVEDRICKKIDELRKTIFGDGQGKGLRTELAVLKASVQTCQTRHAGSTKRRWDIWKILIACLASAFGSQLLSMNRAENASSAMAQPAPADSPRPGATP